MVSKIDPTLISVPLSEINQTWVVEEAIPNLRWKGGRLQQMFLVNHNGPGLARRQTREWRYVPEVADGAKDTG